jgi:hypothetical protein
MSKTHVLPAQNVENTEEREELLALQQRLQSKIQVRPLVHALGSLYLILTW